MRCEKGGYRRNVLPSELTNTIEQFIVYVHRNETHFTYIYAYHTIMELDTNWKDRGIRKELKMKLAKALIWPVITYGPEGWTLKKDDERQLEAAEMWCYRILLRISWTEKRTNKSILNEQDLRWMRKKLAKRRPMWRNSC